MTPAFHPEAALAYKEGLEVRGESAHPKTHSQQRLSWGDPGRLLGERGAGAEQELASQELEMDLPLSIAFKALSLERSSSSSSSQE